MVVQLVPLPASTLEAPIERPKSSATHELVFQAAAVPPLGHKSYYVLKTGAKMSYRGSRKPLAGERVSITNQVTRPFRCFKRPSVKPALPSFFYIRGSQWGSTSTG